MRGDVFEAFAAAVDHEVEVVADIDIEDLPAAAAEVADEIPTDGPAGAGADVGDGDEALTGTAEVDALEALDVAESFEGGVGVGDDIGDDGGLAEETRAFEQFRIGFGRALFGEDVEKDVHFLDDGDEIRGDEIGFWGEGGND